MSFEIGVSRVKKSKDRDEQLGSEDVFSPMPPSEGLKMLCQQCSQDTTLEITLTDHSRWSRGMCRERIFTVKFAGGLHILTRNEGLEQIDKLVKFCRSMYGMRGAASVWGDAWSDVLKENSMKVGTACPAFLISCGGNFQRIVSW